MIDNRNAPTYTQLNAGTHIGYDVTVAANYAERDATSQGSHAFAKATIHVPPIGTTTVVNGATTGVRVVWKNPC